MTKVDLKRTLKYLYGPSAKAIMVIDVPPMNFLKIDGHGDPETSQEYKDAIEALYAVSFGLKFTIKEALGVDYTVLPLEGLWWSVHNERVDLDRNANWYWTSMIMQPDPITAEHVVATIEQVRHQKNLPALDKIRFEPLHEGLSAQVLYIGPYAKESPTIDWLHEFIRHGHYCMAGKHHEIYLSDPRRTEPDKLRTIIRQPIRCAPNPVTNN